MDIKEQIENNKIYLLKLLKNRKTNTMVHGIRRMVFCKKTNMNASSFLIKSKLFTNKVKHSTLLGAIQKIEPRVFFFKKKTIVF